MAEQANGKTLYVLRHAKSDWRSAATDDFSRPLNERGRKEAKRLGRHLRRQNVLPHAVVSSPALRAAKTASIVCKQLGYQEELIHFSPELYLAKLDVLLATIHATSPQHRSLLLVGHNPGLEELLDFLLDPAPRFDDNKLLPTSTLYALQLPDWQVRRGSAHLLFTARARHLADT